MHSCFASNVHICYYGLAGYSSWVMRRSFQESTFKWKKNSFEKINVTIQKYVHFPCRKYNSDGHGSKYVLRSEMG